MAVVWAVLALPTILWWSESILWVAFMSLYANFGTHLAAFQAARSERKLKQVTEDSKRESTDASAQQKVRGSGHQ